MQSSPELRSRLVAEPLAGMAAVVTGVAARALAAHSSLSNPRFPSARLELPVRAVLLDSRRSAGQPSGSGRVLPLALGRVLPATRDPGGYDPVP